ncbi:hypothetical protein SAMN04487765_1682 [Tenacibaculum sp. MAR_2010_89]|uniref:hypothetical protein n=1 Tax=Tenacibaculum sp. MAR_2010_89 TaxID=1250198 RepID=UPI00089C1E5A|nr:hypothetical protein [Tenacibaculum sp. MAR_2010_89]SEE18374.1 hypothetical protein SAMN04487765_1682 [Tenacibaculum sp. MAR_2010_89]
MKKENKKNITNKDLDKFVAQEIKEVAKEKEIHLFKNLSVGISISDSSEIEELGYSIEHQRSLIIEITRYLIIHGSKLIYGGDLRNGGYTRLFSDLVYQYRPSNEANKKFYVNFFSFPIHTKLLESDRLDFKRNRVDIIKVQPPNKLDIDESKFYIPNTFDNLFIWAESLTKMRLEMTKMTNARIFTGGSMSNFKGKYPGLLEEALLSLKKDIPVYFVGLFGGITKRIIEGIQGKNPKELTLKWQSETNNSYREFMSFYNNKVNDRKIDYDDCIDFLNNYSLERLSQNNGLTIEENKRLFTTTHTTEIIFLIMKGLMKKNK